MASNPGLTEYRLAFSDRNSAEALSGAKADARRIQNVLFGHGIAGDFNLGLDLQSYLHEISDSSSLVEINNKIRIELGKYLPDIDLREIAVDVLSPDQDPSNTKNSSLIVGFSLGIDLGKKFEFAIIAGINPRGLNIVSTLVL